MKRFTDTNKWEDTWYQDLPMKYKLLWNFILDKCEHFGVWKVNIKLAVFLIGESFEYTEAKRIFNEKIVEFKEGYWFIKKFIPFQYGDTLSRTIPPHKKVIKFLEENPVLRGFIPEVSIVDMSLTKYMENQQIPKGYITLKDKDKEKDKDKDKDKEQEIESELIKKYKLDNPEFLEKWEVWREYRISIKKPLSVHSIRIQLKQLSKCANPVETIEKSISNNWQGLFPDKKERYFYTLEGIEYEVIDGAFMHNGTKILVSTDKCVKKF